ncbi:PH domain-containing protein [Coprinopsis cinerea okayama7|uniref:PH domain-containing protein n=1 Tax=Coprinopsis cinerea (strain Okayama-7 / 130 / ATCC MYA-4618 / FGSC 9003) TaxID=240176 RepID=A8NUA4_COPC7|nr:PH domain-containing protein [Coprinopsis cinerea okayama7\|eukprot:XP_001836411.1 PH domain-containing protein [Coprinopsis cinerea okayama7\
MSPAAVPPSPQEIQRKLSVHSVSRPKPALGHVSGTESDSDSIQTPDILSGTLAHGGFPHLGNPSQQPPLSSIAERRSASGEDTDEEDAVEGGWRTPDLRRPRNSIDESVLKSGYLWKKGERRKTWKKRWFVLRPAHLAYYKSNAEYQTLKLLDLSDIHSCTPVNLKRHDNAFSLISPNRTFYFQADSPEDVRSWVAAIEGARQTLMATSTQNSASTPIPIARSSQAHGGGAGTGGKVLTISSSPGHLHPITSSDSEDGGAGGTTTGQRGYHSGSAPSPTAINFLTPSKPSTSTTANPSKVIVSGYLMKCGSKRRNWRKRWFVLTGEKLVYSGSHMDPKPHRTFPFSEILDALEYELPANRHPHAHSATTSSPPSSSAVPEVDEASGSHTFKIVTTKRTLLLCAPSEEDEIKWLGAIRALIARRSDSGVVPGELSKLAISSGHHQHEGSGGSGTATHGLSSPIPPAKSKSRRMSFGTTSLGGGGGSTSVAEGVEVSRS